MSRIIKLEKQLKQLISEWITIHSYLNQNLILTTITEVNMSNDCSFAMVYITSFHDTINAAELLNEKKFDIQKTIATTLNLKRTPRIRFKVDKGSEEYKKISDILNEK